MTKDIQEFGFEDNLMEEFLMSDDVDDEVDSYDTDDEDEGEEDEDSGDEDEEEDEIEGSPFDPDEIGDWEE